MMMDDEIHYHNKNECTEESSDDDDDDDTNSVQKEHPKSNAGQKHKRETLKFTGTVRTELDDVVQAVAPVVFVSPDGSDEDDDDDDDDDDDEDELVLLPKATIIMKKSFSGSNKMKEYTFDETSCNWVEKELAFNLDDDEETLPPTPKKRRCRRNAATNFPETYQKRGSYILGACFRGGYRHASELCYTYGAMMILTVGGIDVCCVTASSFVSNDKNDGKAGRAGCGGSKPKFEIQRIGVLHEYRKSGYGRYALALMERAMSQIVMNGYDKTTLLLDGFTKKSHFYLSSGYTINSATIKSPKKKKGETRRVVRLGSDLTPFEKIVSDKSSRAFVKRAMKRVLPPDLDNMEK